MTSRKIGDQIIFWGFGASGVAALIYEVVWSRALTNTIGGTIYSFSILLAAFLAGLAVGSRFGGKFATDKDPLRIFGVLQLGIGLFGILTLYIINNLGSIYAELFYQLRMSFAIFTLAQMALVFLVMLVPTSLMGATFPVAVKAWSSRLNEIGKNAGDVYAVNTWGAVFGSLAAGFIFIPIFGLTWANTIAAGINLTLSAVAFIIAGSKRWASVTPLIFIVVSLLALFEPSPGIAFSYGVADHYSSHAEFKRLMSDVKVLFDKRSPYGRVRVLEESPGPDRVKQLLLSNGGRLEGSTEKDAPTQKLIAYLPLAIHGNPRSLMNIGLGTGMTLNTARRDRRIKVIHSIEINPVIKEAVAGYFFPVSLATSGLGLT